MSTNYEYLHDSDINRLAYILCALMDCRKCPIGLGRECVEELKEWLDKPMTDLIRVDFCPVCGKRVITEAILPTLDRFRVHCGCSEGQFCDTQAEAYDSWKAAMNLNWIPMASDGIGHIRTSRPLEEAVRTSREKTRMLVKEGRS